MDKALHHMMICLRLLIGVVLLTAGLSRPIAAQDQDDPPDRVARLGYLQGSVSFQPAGESDWVGAVPNRPMTTGDQLWADQDSRAEVQLGSAAIRLAPNTGFSFLNLDDRTVQIQLTSGSLNISVRNLNRDDVFEIDTPNQAFSIFEHGRYRVEASEDGTYTVASVREGEGESTGNGQTYSVLAGQRVTLSGTESLNAEVVRSAARMTLITGQIAVIAVTRDRVPPIIFRGMLLVMRIWTIMATGATIRTTDMSGSPTGLPPDGRLIERGMLVPQADRGGPRLRVNYLQNRAGYIWVSFRPTEISDPYGRVRIPSPLASSIAACSQYRCVPSGA